MIEADSKCDYVSKKCKVLAVLQFRECLEKVRGFGKPKMEDGRGQKSVCWKYKS